MASEMNDRKWAGLLLAIGAAQFMLVLVVAQSLYPNYSVANNFISDLGVGPTAGLFNSSIMLLGACVLTAACLLWKEFREPAFAVALGLCALGAIGVGIFPEGTPGGLHLLVLGTTFFFASLAAMLVFRLKLEKMAARLSAGLGAISLVTLALYAFKIYLGLGPGGMERMIAYPVLIWAVGAGGYWLAGKEG